MFEGAWESGIELETVSFQKMIPDLLWKWIGMVIINFDSRCRIEPQLTEVKSSRSSIFVHDVYM